MPERAPPNGSTAWDIAVSDLHFAYRPAGREAEAFELRCRRWRAGGGAHVAIVGPSGSGKTTFLHLLAGILIPAAGRIDVGPVAISTLPDAQRRRFRIEHVGFVFQDFGLLDYLSVHENIVLPYLVHPALARGSVPWDRAAELAREAGLAELLRRNVTQLSQGERQRVGICRALVTGPKVILADEPTGNLDPANKHRTVALLQTQARRHGATLVMVTHDRGLLGAMDRVDDFGHIAEPEGLSLEEPV